MAKNNALESKLVSRCGYGCGAEMAGALNCMISSNSHADLLKPYKKFKGSCWKCRPWFGQQQHDDGYGRRKHAIVAAAASSSASSF